MYEMRPASTVPTRMDWDGEGLLEGLEDDAARDARRRLLDELHADGMDVEELRRVVAEDKLVLAPVAQALSSEARYTARELAERADVSLEFLTASRRALGLPVPDADERVYGEKDLEATRLGTLHRAAGFDDEDALEVARVLGQGMARYADATRALVARTFIEPGLDEYELAHRYRAVAEQLMPLAGPWLEHVYALHLQQVLRSDALTQEQRRAGKLDDTQEAVIAFADLVGFTELGESVPVEELGSVAGRLSRLAGEACDPPVRLVKLIGDAVMLVSPEPAAMLDVTLRLVDLAAEDEAFPPLRAGIACGQAVHRWGDWFGTPVNLASRLTTRARPSTVLVSEEVRDAVGEGYEFSDAGRKKLKGFASPVRAYRAKKAVDAAPAAPER
jgi:adenylate cyclase